MIAPAEDLVDRYVWIYERSSAGLFAADEEVRTRITAALNVAVYADAQEIRVAAYVRLLELILGPEQQRS